MLSGFFFSKGCQETTPSECFHQSKLRSGGRKQRERQGKPLPGPAGGTGRTCLPAAGGTGMPVPRHPAGPADPSSSEPRGQLHPRSFRTVGLSLPLTASRNVYNSHPCLPKAEAKDQDCINGSKDATEYFLRAAKLPIAVIFNFKV